MARKLISYMLTVQDGLHKYIRLNLGDIKVVWPLCVLESCLHVMQTWELSAHYVNLRVVCTLCRLKSCLHIVCIYELSAHRVYLRVVHSRLEIRSYLCNELTLELYPHCVCTIYCLQNVGVLELATKPSTLKHLILELSALLQFR